MFNLAKYEKARKSENGSTFLSQQKKICLYFSLPYPTMQKNFSRCQQNVVQGWWQ